MRVVGGVTSFRAERVGRGVESGLENKDVLFPDGFPDGDGRLVVGELLDGAEGEGNAESDQVQSSSGILFGIASRPLQPSYARLLHSKPFSMVLATPSSLYLRH